MVLKYGTGEIWGDLADETRLGKTIQMISLILADPECGPTLIVVPTSLMTQWKSEIQKFTGGEMRVEIAHNSDPNGLRIELMRTKVYITSYGTVARNVGVFSDASLTWGRVILGSTRLATQTRPPPLMTVKARWLYRCLKTPRI